MADVTVAPQQIARAGIAPTYQAIDATDTYLMNNAGRMFVQLKNTGGSPSVVSIVTPGTVDGLAIAERTFTVPATTGDRMAGSWPPSVYNAAGEHLIRLTQDQATGVTLGAFIL